MHQYFKFYWSQKSNLYWNRIWYFNKKFDLFFFSVWYKNYLEEILIFHQAKIVNNKNNECLGQCVKDYLLSFAINVSYHKTMYFYLSHSYKPHWLLSPSVFFHYWPSILFWYCNLIPKNNVKLRWKFNEIRVI